MLKTPVPNGFSIAFSRHGKRWGWKQRYKRESPDHVLEQWGFHTRREALAGLTAEIERRKKTASRSRAAPELAQPVAEPT